MIDKSINSVYTNWAKNTTYNKKIEKPKNLSELKKFLNKEKNREFGLCGNFRSFNDTCINKTKLISLEKFEKKVILDKKKSTVYATSNVKLKDLLCTIVPTGYMLYVTPGSKFVTIGGMIANNVIGKNARKNQIKYFIEEIEILINKNKILKCSKNKNSRIFNLTVGGFGLTGIILSAKLKLKKINNQYIEEKIKKFYNVKEFINFTKIKSQYAVSWVDSHSLNSNTFRGLYFIGEHYKKKENLSNYLFNNNNMNFFAKIFLKNYIKIFFFSKIVNYIFFILQRQSKLVSFDKFFYPQDKWLDFNECYSNGFFQVQFLVKQNNFDKIIKKISLFFREENIKSTFIILKKMDESGNYLNFYGKGISISFDFEKNNKYLKIKKFFNNLYQNYDIKVNLSKDFIVNRKLIQNTKSFKNLKKELILINKSGNKYKNEFSKRLRIS